MLDIIDVLAYDKDGNELTLRGTIEKLQNFNDTIYPAEILTALGVGLGELQPVLDLIIYDNAGNALNVGGVIERVQNFGELITIEVINALDVEELKEGGHFKGIVDVLAYDADGNALTVDETITKLKDFQNTMYLVDIADASGFTYLMAGGELRGLVELLGYNGEPIEENKIALGETIDKLLNIQTTIPVHDLIEALNLRYTGTLGEMINIVFIGVVVDSVTGNSESVRLTIEEAVENFGNIELGRLANAFEINLGDFGLAGNGIEELTLNQIKEGGFSVLAERMELANVISVLSDDNEMAGLIKLISLTRLTKRTLQADGFIIDTNGKIYLNGQEVELYDGDGNKIEYSFSHEHEYRYVDGVEVGDMQYFLVDQNGEYVYEAFMLEKDGEGNVIIPADDDSAEWNRLAIRDSVMLSEVADRINSVAIGELIPGYNTDSKYDILRMVIKPEMNISQLLDGEGLSVDDVVIEAFLDEDVLDPTSPNYSSILAAIAYDSNGDAVTISGLDERINEISISSIIKGYDSEDSIISKILPGTTTLGELSNGYDFGAKIDALTVVDLMGEAEYAAASDLIKTLLPETTTLADITDPSELSDRIYGLELGMIIPDAYGAGSIIAELFPSTTKVSDLNTAGFIDDQIDKLALGTLMPDIFANAGANEIINNILSSTDTVEDLKTSGFLEGRINGLTAAQLGLTFEDTGDAKKDAVNEVLRTLIPSNIALKDIEASLQDNLGTLKLETVLKISQQPDANGSYGSALIDALVKEGTTIDTLATDINKLTLGQIVDVKIMVEYDVNGIDLENDGFEEALYIYDEANREYVLVSLDNTPELFAAGGSAYYVASKNEQMGTYHYVGLDKNNTFYVINSDAQIWFLLFADATDNGTTVTIDETKGWYSVNYGSPETIKFTDNINLTMGNLVNAHVDFSHVKFNVLETIGVVDHSTAAHIVADYTLEALIGFAAGVIESGGYVPGA